jgi:hypothetical protein
VWRRRDEEKKRRARRKRGKASDREGKVRCRRQIRGRCAQPWPEVREVEMRGAQARRSDGGEQQRVTPRRRQRGARRDEASTPRPARPAQRPAMRGACGAASPSSRSHALAALLQATRRATPPDAACCRSVLHLTRERMRCELLWRIARDWELGAMPRRCEALAPTAHCCSSTALDCGAR